jgi:hypothetical protein
MGIPGRIGSFSVRAEVSDSRGERASGSFTLVIRAGTLMINPDRVGDGVVGVPYSAQISAMGGVPPYKFSLNGSLPPGVTFNAAAQLTGTPTEPGTFNFTVEATDEAGQKGEREYSMAVTAGRVSITTSSLGDGQVRLAYAATLTALGGTRPYSWSVSGLPGGLTVNAQTGAISGTPSEAGTFSITATVSDRPGETATREFSMRVRPALVLSGSLPSSAMIGSQVSATLTASGGLPPYTWESTGSLPPGVSFSGGVLSGSPTTAGSYAFSVLLRDAAGATEERSTTLVVTTALRITTGSLPDGTVGSAYSQSIGATGGRTPYRWSASGLPAGLGMTDDGTISGTPTAGGRFTVAVSVGDTSTPALSASTSLALNIALPPVSSVTLGGVPDSPPPAQQSNLTVSIGQPYPAPITGRVTLTFAPNAANNADDPAIQFSTGGRSVPFTIPAGSTQGVFPASTVAIQTGTVAGVITLTTALESGGSAVNCNCPLTRTLTIARSVPSISSVRVVRTANGFNVMITGFSTTREILQATFRFGGTNLQTNEVVVPLTPVFNTWFQGAQSAQFGGQFVLTMPFTVQGDAAGVTSVTVTLANAQGSSQPMTANF